MSRRRKQQQGGHGGTDRWLITYSDLITLLLVFFIVLYAMSKLDVAKFNTLSLSLASAMYNKSQVEAQSGGDSGILNAYSNQPNKNSTTGKDNSQSAQAALTQQEMQQLAQARQEQDNLAQVEKQLTEFIQQQGLANFLSVDLTQEGIQITLRDVALFDTGSADLKPDARRILAGLSPFMNLDAVKDHDVRVEGHTDNRPIATPQFPSNWALSSARATNVVSFLQSQSIAPERMSAVGYGEYRPVQPNDTVENQSMNRRVNIIILRKNPINN
ncbi:MAG: OmpA/MotB domain protein [Bacilli bacterium]|nr:OmpA/MotB domain protein [Bacilli bacterium]